MCQCLNFARGWANAHKFVALEENVWLHENVKDASMPKKLCCCTEVSRMCRCPQICNLGKRCDCTKMSRMCQCMHGSSRWRKCTIAQRNQGCANAHKFVAWEENMWLCKNVKDVPVHASLYSQEKLCCCTEELRMCQCTQICSLGRKCVIAQECWECASACKSLVDGEIVPLHRRIEDVPMHTNL